MAAAHPQRSDIAASTPMEVAVMRTLATLTLVLLIVPLADRFALAADPHDDFFTDFVVGYYDLIGRREDGEAT